MDFEFDEKQKLMQRTLDDLLKRVCPQEYSMECDDKGEAPMEAYKEMAKDGWIGVSTPEEFGGMGGDEIDMSIVLETAGHHYLDLGTMIFRNICYGCDAILASGTVEQKKKFVTSTVKGETFFAFSLTEPDAGSDAASIITRADREQNVFKITGTKNYTSGMPIATDVLVAVRTDKKAEKHKGITNFIIPADREGIEWKKLRLMGHRAMGTCEVHYNGVEAFDKEILGNLDDGWSGLMKYITTERLCLSAARTGAAANALQMAIKHAQERHQFGKPIGKFQAVSHMITEMHTLVDTARLQVYRFAWLASQGKAGRLEAATLKLYAAEAYKKVADLGVQVLGGYGYSAEFPMERHYRDARLATIGAGSSEIQRNIMAKELGL